MVRNGYVKFTMDGIDGEMQQGGHNWYLTRNDHELLVSAGIDEESQLHYWMVLDQSQSEIGRRAILWDALYLACHTLNPLLPDRAVRGDQRLDIVAEVRRQRRAQLDAFESWEIEQAAQTLLENVAPEGIVDRG